MLRLWALEDQPYKAPGAEILAYTQGCLLSDGRGSIVLLLHIGGDSDEQYAGEHLPHVVALVAGGCSVHRREIPSKS